MEIKKHQFPVQMELPACIRQFAFMGPTGEPMDIHERTMATQQAPAQDAVMFLEATVFQITQAP